MAGYLVVAEHRQGRLREVTLEMLQAAGRLSRERGGETTALLLGSAVDHMAEELAGYSDRVVYIDDPLLENYTPESYGNAVAETIQQYSPELVMTGYTTQGMDLAPTLAVKLKMPFISDVIGLGYSGDMLQAVRQYYQGKVNARFVFKGNPPYLATIREASFETGSPAKQGRIEKLETTLKESTGLRRFVQFLEAEAGDVDITQSEVLICVGRGLREEKNMPMIEELAAVMNADICGSRAATDAGWLPPDRQVGTSGKAVKPRLYVAIGISGAFQHLAGIKGAKTVVAINKDPNAPIFSAADYGIVDDLFKVVPLLTEKLGQMLK